MPIPHRFHVKYFFKNDVPLPDFIPVFHRWIQRGLTGQLLIDVHNYSHVHNGAGILLVGHEGDYAADVAAGRLGLLYRLKRGEFDSLAEAARLALERAREGVNLLEQDRSLKDKVVVDVSGFDVTIPDRLRFSNTPATFAAIVDELTDAIALATGAESVSLHRVENDEREPLLIRATLG